MFNKYDLEKAHPLGEFVFNALNKDGEVDITDVISAMNVPGNIQPKVRKAYRIVAADILIVLEKQGFFERHTVPGSGASKRCPERGGFMWKAKSFNK